MGTLAVALLKGEIVCENLQNAKNLESLIGGSEDCFGVQNRAPSDLLDFGESWDSWFQKLFAQNTDS